MAIKINKKLVLSSVIVLSIVLVGSCMFTQTLTFAISQIKKSFKTHDYELFTKYVDVKSVMGSITDESESTNSGLSTLIETAMAPAITEMAEDNIRKMIEESDDGIAWLRYGVFELFTDSSFTSKDMKVKTSGKITTVSIPQYISSKYDVKADVVLTFRKSKGKYILTKIDESLVESKRDDFLSAMNKYYNAKTQTKIDSLVEVKVLGVKMGCSNYSSYSDYCFDEIVMVKASITNKSKYLIKEVSLDMYPDSIYLGDYSYLRRHTVKNIKPGETILCGTKTGWDYNQFSHDDVLWGKASAKDIVFKEEVITEGDTLEISDDAYYRDYEPGDASAPSKETIEALIAQ